MEPKAAVFNFLVTIAGMRWKLGDGSWELGVSGESFVNFVERFAQVITKFPTWVMLLKLADVANPPDVIANSVFLLVFPSHFPATDLFAQTDRFQDGAIGMAASANVVNLTSSW